MPSKKHMEELERVAGEIYDLAADRITEYCRKKYADEREDTVGQQLEDYISIADQVSAYLLGNALALVDPSTDEEELAGFAEHIRKVAAYVRLRSEENGELN